MKVHSEQTIQRLKFLRRKGYSIEALVRELSIPKTTVWHHIHNIKLSEKYRRILKSNQGGSRIKKERALQQAREEAQRLLKSLDKHLYISVACLYWAEGSKRRCEFINTDGQMIQFYLRILRRYFKVSEDRIQAVLRIFSNHDKKTCLDYWSKITGIPENKFQIFLNDGGTVGRGYGMCRIVVLKGGYTLKLFQAIIEEISK